MKLFRSVIFWLHLVAGVAAGAIVIVMSATGVALTYQRQVQVWADTRGLEPSSPAPGTVPLEPAALVAAAAGARDGDPTALRWRSEQEAVVEVVFGRDGSVWMDAHTGAVLGTGSASTRAFFRSMTDWHRWLARSGDARDTGRSITGLANLLFLFIVLSGFYLWWPPRWTLARLRNITLFRRGLTPKARDFNWHNVIGFWSLVPLAVVVASGVVISYPWAGNLVYRLAGDTPPPARGAPAPATPAAAPSASAAPAGGQPANQSAAQPAPVAAASTVPDEAGEPAREHVLPASAVVFAAASVEAPDWRIVTLQLKPAEEGASISVDRGDGGQPHKRATLVIDPVNGGVVEAERFADGTSGRRARSILRFAHTGEVLGVPGQTIAGIVSLGSLVLVWTGIALALRRLAGWLRRRRPGAAEVGRAEAPGRRTRQVASTGAEGSRAA